MGNLEVNRSVIEVADPALRRAIDKVFAGSVCSDLDPDSFMPYAQEDEEYFAGRQDEDEIDT